MTVRAVVLEVKDGTCTVLTAGGEFRKLKMRGSFRPGQEITLPDARWKINRLALVAACLLLFFAATAMWRTVMAPAVAAYVSLDINPAVELALDGKNMVCEIKPLDDDGKALVDGLGLKGMTLEKALERIILAAVEKKYIVDKEGNTIVTTITPVGDYDPSRLDLLVRESVEATLVSFEIRAQVLVGSASPEIREKAEREGVPPGRYMMFVDAAKKGMPVNLEDFKKKSIPSIERDQKIKVKNGLEVEEEDGGKTRLESRRNGGEGRDRDVREGHKVRESSPGEAAPGSEQVKGGGGQGSKSRQEGKEQKEEKEEKERKEKEEKVKKEKEWKKEGGQSGREHGKGLAGQAWSPRSGDAEEND